MRSLVATLVVVTLVSGSSRALENPDREALTARVQAFVRAPYVIADDIVALYPLTQDDATDVFRCARDADVVRLTAALGSRLHTSIDDTRAFIARGQTSMAAGNALWFTVRDRATNAFLGVAALYINTIHARAECALVLDKSCWYQGIGRRVLNLGINFGFSYLGLERLQADCDPENIASRRLLDSSPLAFEGRLRNYYRVHGAMRDRLMYAITREELLRARDTAMNSSSLYGAGRYA